jgi:YggT family protein
MGHFANAGNLVIGFVFGLLLFIVLLRVVLQLVRANFYNPICQAIYKLTNPVLMPLQKLLPVWRGLNTAGCVVAWLLACLWVALPAWMSGVGVGPLALAVLGFAKLLAFALQALFWITLVRVILSWVNPDFDQPAVPLVYRISDLLLKPFQRVIPPLGGFDLSALVALLALQVAQALVVAPLYGFGASLAGAG